MIKDNLWKEVEILYKGSKYIVMLDVQRKEEWCLKYSGADNILIKKTLDSNYTFAKINTLNK